jgi:hypothetical protein
MKQYYNDIEGIYKIFNSQKNGVFNIIFLRYTLMLLILKATDGIRIITNRYLQLIVQIDKNILTNRDF